MVGITSSSLDYEIKEVNTAITLFTLSIIFFFHWFMRDHTFEEIIEKLPSWVWSVAIALMLVAIATFSGEDRAFIYFQF